VLARKGEYLPFLDVGVAAEVEKVGEYTRNGAVEESLEIRPGEQFPQFFPNYQPTILASWEIDVWKKLRHAKNAALSRYLASLEGRNFMVTNLVSEIAEAYYELVALDNLLQTVQRNIQIQSDALKVVKQQKASAKVTQLAVNRFEAQMLNTKNLQYPIKQRITEVENRIFFLTGQFPGEIQRNSAGFDSLRTDSVTSGLPSDLLLNRPDIRQAEQELAAARLDIKVARARFYPTFDISLGLGLAAFNPKYLISPESALINLAGDIAAPLVNRKAIKAEYFSAGARQVQAAYDYEQSILNAYVDVLNQLAMLNNYTQSYDTKAREVRILNESVAISTNLFNSARADYAEVLLTQEEALDSRIELIEIKLKQLQAWVNLYRALGGGWR
jgi:multidrug efflux system outer membrane protein